MGQVPNITNMTTYVRNSPNDVSSRSTVSHVSGTLVDGNPATRGTVALASSHLIEAPGGVVFDYVVSPPRRSTTKRCPRPVPMILDAVIKYREDPIRLSVICTRILLEGVNPSRRSYQESVSYRQSGDHHQYGLFVCPHAEGESCSHVNSDPPGQRTTVGVVSCAHPPPFLSPLLSCLLFCCPSPTRSLPILRLVSCVDYVAYRPGVVVFIGTK